MCVYSQRRRQYQNHISHSRPSIQVLEDHPVLTKDHPALFLSLQRYDDYCIQLPRKINQ